jgi:superfamily II DNA or RNA helicase
LVVAPKTPIFDSWKEDIKKWKLQDIIHVDYVWSNSLKKVDDFYDLIVADEIHEYNQKVLQELSRRIQNGSRVLGLTGTLDSNSEDTIKFWTGISPIYTYTVEQAIKDKIVADYKIYCIGCELDSETPYVKIKLNQGTVLMTEFEAYTYWDRAYENAKARQRYKGLKFLMAQRKSILYNSKTKLKLARKIIRKLDRCIIFSGTQDIANRLGDAPYHSKSDKSSLIDFQEGRINKLSAVSMISMGITISNLKNAVFNQLKSGENLAVQQAMRAMNIDGDKEASIYITYIKDTRDEVWLQSALNGFEESKIKYCEFKDLKFK